MKLKGTLKKRFLEEGEHLAPHEGSWKLPLLCWIFQSALATTISLFGEIDEPSVYSILEYTRVSLKDLGRRLFAFSKMEVKAADILKSA